ncbi:DNA-binding protein [Bremerella cremea]|uniref:DNA-binding protein n=1 Tax=Bremerella cremea TaxID=1031537 RepID=A0A368KKF6_9BACT|nr:DNA-binding protein [Bremerella cremea]
MSERLLLSQTELARLLELSSRTISRMNASRKIPQPVRVGRSVRWRRDEVEQWIAAGCPERNEWEARRITVKHN